MFLLLTSHFMFYTYQGLKKVGGGGGMWGGGGCMVGGSSPWPKDSTCENTGG